MIYFVEIGCRLFKVDSRFEILRVNFAINCIFYGKVTHSPNFRVIMGQISLEEAKKIKIIEETEYSRFFCQNSSFPWITSLAFFRTFSGKFKTNVNSEKNAGGKKQNAGPRVLRSLIGNTLAGCRSLVRVL